MFNGIRQASEGKRGAVIALCTREPAWWLRFAVGGRPQRLSSIVRARPPAAQA